jgi:3-ketoacyl-CoA synthase
MSSWSNVKRFQLLYKRVATIFVHIVTTVAIASVVLIKFPQWLADVGKLMPHLCAISPIHLLLAVVLLTVTATLYHALRPRTVYLVDYACFTPSTNHRYPKATFLEHAHHSPWLKESSLSFIDRVLERSGMSDETYAPPLFLYVEPRCRLDEARVEAELVVFSMIDDLFAKTRINIHSMDILITNCTVF